MSGQRLGGLRLHPDTAGCYTPKEYYGALREWTDAKAKIARIPILKRDDQQYSFTRIFNANWCHVAP